MTHILPAAVAPAYTNNFYFQPRLNWDYANPGLAPEVHPVDPRGMWELARWNQPFDFTSSAVGLSAREWGMDGCQVNPRTGTCCWSGNCWGWLNGALMSAGVQIPGMAAPNPREAYRQLEKSGDLQFGAPPPGTVVFAGRRSSGSFQVGIANEDGKTFRTTVRPERSSTGIGDRRMPRKAAYVHPTQDNPNRGKLIDSEAVHMTQTFDREYNAKGKRTSGDCAPTSLAMALKALGLDPKGNVQEKIDRCRWESAHGVRNDRDGYTASGKWSSAEHHEGMTRDDIRRGAQRLGAKAKKTSSLSSIKKALLDGKPVVMMGEHGSRLWGDKHGLYRYNKGHAIMVSRYNPQTKMFTVNDPLSHKGPFQVHERDLARFNFSGTGNTPKTGPLSALILSRP